MSQFCSSNCENSVKMLCTVEDLKFEASRTLDIWQSNAAVLAKNTLEALRVGLEEAHPLSPKHIDVAPPGVTLTGSSFGSSSLTRPNHRSPFMLSSVSSGAGVSFGYNMGMAVARIGVVGSSRKKQQKKTPK